MPVETVLRAINALVLVLALVVLGAGYYFLWRTLPEDSGRLPAPVSGEVRVERDARGVPHITAPTVEDALFAQGYVTAQDRLWQMDAIRRRAAGELSEIAGRAALESDTTARKLRLRRIAEDSALRLNPQDRALLGAYARGVNHFIRTHHGRYSPEFQLLSYAPRPWRISDTLLVGLEMYRTLTTTWDDDLLRFQMLEGGQPEKVRALFPPRSGEEILPGSNAWAISGRHTASGKPILANDPHLPFTNPATWHMAHLKAPGLNVAGATLPGVPGIISGHNEFIAWGITNLGYDVQDLYLEQIDLRTGRYSHKAEVLQARAENEWVAVRGEKPVPMVAWVTIHGPVFTTVGRHAFTLKWTAAEHGLSSYAILDINRARNWQEFRAALRRFSGPGQNFVYADREGNIGYQATGWLPVRKGFDGSFPLDGASGLNEWEGIIPFEELPSSLNPPSGRIVSANQNVFPENLPYEVSGQFASHYRQRQIDDRLGSRQVWKPEEMLTIQKDVYSGLAHFLAQAAVRAVELHSAPPASALDGAGLLAGWNGQMEVRMGQPFLAQLLFQHVRRMLAEQANPGKGAQYRSEISGAVVEGLLRERPAGWVEDWDKLLVQALADAVDEGRRMQGRNLRKWDWGAFNAVALQHPVFARVPLASSWFNIGPVPMSGSSFSIKQTTRALGPSMRFVADLSEWDQSRMNLTLGQSGHRLSGHYKDHWEAYYVGKSFPLEFERIQAKAKLILAPGP
jgi:penicillin amidase